MNIEIMSFWDQKYGIRFVTKWDAMEVERFLTRPISIIYSRASSLISMFAGFHVFNFLMVCFNYYYFIFGASGSTQGAPWDHQASVWRQMGSPVTILEAFWVQVALQEITETGQIHFASVSRDSVR